MVIGGLQRVSLSDFPGRIAAIVFTRGCNFRCPYCHNPELVDPARYTETLPQEEVLHHLSIRSDILQGVVVTGGEPLLQDDLPAFLQAARGLGLATKVDTNGSRPDHLRDLVKRGLVDYVALDLKAPLDSYERVAGAGMDPDSIEESLRFVMKSGIEHEIRTTYSRRFLSLDDLREIAALVRGCRRFALQAFRPSRTLDPALLGDPSPLPDQMEEARLIFQSAGIPITIR